VHLLPADGSFYQFLASGDASLFETDQTSESQMLCFRGTLTKEGIECPALRIEDNKALYTLVGETVPFQAGDDVCVCGSVAEVSFCMQGITIAITHISLGEQGCPP